MKLTGINKTYLEGRKNEKVALNDINLEFDNKGLVFILGKSGSGKTTLLNIIAGLDCPTSGELTDGDVDITKFSSNELNMYRKNNIGFIFQNYGLVYELTVMENILLGLKKTPEKIAKAKEYLEKFDLLSYENASVNQLSGGQEQRVAIIRALVKKSKIILADEPTGNLDSINGNIIYDVLKEISKDSLVIVVSHDQEGAYKYGDRIIVLQDGSIEEDTKLSNNEKKLGIVVEDEHEELTNNTLFKLSRKFMYSNKVKVILSTLLMSITLSILGLLILFVDYDFSEISTRIFSSEDTKFIGIGKGYTDKETGKFIQSFRTIDQVTQQELEKLSNDKAVDRKYLIQGMIITDNETGSEYLPTNVSYAMVSSEKKLEKYNFSMEYGIYPETKSSVAITDYLAYVISILNPKLITDILHIDNISEIKDDTVLVESLKKTDKGILVKIFGQDWKEVINKQETLDTIRKNPGILLLGSKVDFVTNKYEISGIIETSFEDQYKDLIYMSPDDMKNDDRSAIFNYNFGNFYCNFYVTEEFLDNLYVDKIIYSDCVYLKYSAYKDLLGLEEELTGTDTYITTNYFRDYFKEEFSLEKINNYHMPNEIYIPLGKNMEDDIIYRNKDSNIIGVFDVPSKYINQLYSNKVIVVSDEFFNEFSKAQIYCSFMYMELPESENNQLTLLKYMKDSDLYYLTPSAQSVYQLTEILRIFDGIFKAITIIITIFTFILITNYFSGLVADRKREIGIMRALGMKKKIIYKIFAYCGVNMLVVTVAISYVFLIAFVKISNKLLGEGYLHYLDNEVVNGLNILNINVGVFIFIAVICVILLGVSIFYSIRKIAKLNIINALKE